MAIFTKTKPVIGYDARWAAFCIKCKDLESMASKGGFKNGGIGHCYTCGNEQTIKGFDESDIHRIILASKYHWLKYPLIPYDWHKLSEQERWNILGVNSSQGSEK